MNSLVLMGNLTKDPEVRPASGNGSFTTFTIAVADGYGEKKQTHFYDVAAGGKCGENIGKYFKKGKQIIIEGKLYTGKNKQSGFDEIRISAYKFHFTSDGSGGGGGRTGNTNNNNNNNNNQNNNNNNQNNNNNNNQYDNSNQSNNNNNNNQQNNNNNQQNNNQNNNQGNSNDNGPVDDIPF
jgi:single stranded DNA-binding protein